MDKPVVYYLGEPRFTHVWNGDFATVFAYNHNRLGQGPVRTSLILKKHKDGSFETMNTLYVPYKEDDDTID